MIGGMKNVKGENSAMPMVAVKPGRAPTNMPSAFPMKITAITSG